MCVVLLNCFNIWTQTQPYKMQFTIVSVCVWARVVYACPERPVTIYLVSVSCCFTFIYTEHRSEWMHRNYLLSFFFFIKFIRRLVEYCLYFCFRMSYARTFRLYIVSVQSTSLRSSIKDPRTTNCNNKVVNTIFFFSFSLYRAGWLCWPHSSASASASEWTLFCCFCCCWRNGQKPKRKTSKKKTNNRRRSGALSRM